MRRFIALITVLLVAASCPGRCGEKKQRLLGGCRKDTVRMGLEIKPSNVSPRTPWRLDILSMDFAGEELYRRAAIRVAGIMDSLKIGIVERSELVHITEGPCWPPYRISHRIRVDDKQTAESLRKGLAESQIAGRSPVLERPSGYGTFFISLVKGERDVWTVWYVGGKTE